MFNPEGWPNAPDAYDLLMEHFKFLLDDYGFKIIRRQKKNRYGQSDIDLSKKGCYEFGIGVDRGTSYILMGPTEEAYDALSLPEDSSMYSAEPRFVKYHIEGGGDITRFLKIGEVADLLKTKHEEICQLFRLENLPKTYKIFHELWLLEQEKGQEEFVKAEVEKRRIKQEKIARWKEKQKRLKKEE